MGDQTRLALGADSEFERFWVASLSHRQPLGHDGAAITGGVNTLRTEPKIGGEGRADSASLVVTFPWIRSYTRNLTVSAGIDGVNSDNAVLGDLVASERVRAVRGSVGYVEANARRAWVLGAAVSQGLDGLGSEALDPSVTLHFTKLTLQVTHVRSLGRSFVVRASVGGQWSGEALPASERFTLGGAAFGRGFAAAETSGDDGFGASGEFAWRTEQSWLSEAYVFADGGRVWTADRLSGPGVMRDIASAGAGVRLSLPRDTRLDLEVAKPIDAAIPGEEAEGWRFRFGLSARL
jgi:hemolysin activation/secretion protein